MRLFFAIELNESVRNCVSAFQEDVKNCLPQPSYRWVKPERYHLTLAFLENVQPEFLPTLIDVARQVCSDHRATNLRFLGLGNFHAEKRPRVLYIAAKEFTGHDTIDGIGDELYKRCLPFTQIEAGNKSVPHVTIGYLTTNLRKELVTAVAAAIDSMSERSCGEMPVSSIALILSNLSGQGPRYEVLERFPLAL